MTLRPGEVAGRAFAVFPFLKTSEPIGLGSFVFRSTEDTTGLSDDDSAHLKEIADMLFLQDDLRIRSATYAILPTLNLDNDEPCLKELEHIQSIVAFCYSHPHPTLGHPFLAFEHASLAIFSPEPVSIFLVRPEHHVTQVGAATKLPQDEWDRVSGYQGRYNFRHPFWVVRNSRLYPPVPHMVLNHSQTLASDLVQFFDSPRYNLLPALLRKPETEAGQRVLTAVSWFNRANALDIDDESAIVNLSIAFETLLALPKDAKTDRFVDAVSLLLGRVARLDEWAEQFYDTRSDVVHRGKTTNLHFSPRTKKTSGNDLSYQPHLIYGRQIFQLCVSAALFGASLSNSAGIADKLITNEERFRFVCKTLEDESLAIADRFKAIADTVALIDEFRFVGEKGLLIKTMVGAVQCAAKNLLASGAGLDSALKERMEGIANAPRSDDFFEALEAMRDLHDLRTASPGDPQSPQALTQRLADAVWHYTFMHYHWLAEQRRNNTGQDSTKDC
jgi:hypothetical protein